MELKSLPSSAKKSSPGSKILQVVAIARAVFILSPVIILTVMPARLHFLIAAGTSGRTGSLKHNAPVRSRNVTYITISHHGT